MSQPVRGNSHLYQSNHYYTAENYRKKFGKQKTEPGDRNTVLQFLIALRQDPTKEIERLKENNLIDYGDKETFGLTPLMVAVIYEDHKTVLELLNAGASPLAKDDRKWTALDHAALLDDPTIFHTLAAKVNRCAAHRVLGRPPANPAEPVFYYRNDLGDVVPGTSEEFQKRVGLPFQAGIVGDRASLIEKWNKPSHLVVMHPDFERLHVHLRDQWEKMRGSLPDVYLGQDKQSIGIDVYARKNFEAGDLMMLYSGKQIPQRGAQSQDDEKSKSPFLNEYVCLGIDADTKFGRNLGGEVCDSFPNCCYFDIQNVDGLETIQVIAALDKIPPHRRLCINYGYGHKIKFLGHKELNRKEMIAYFKQNSLGQLFKRVTELAKSKNDLKASLEHVSIVNKLHYFFETPSAWVDLIFSRIINPKDILRFMGSGYLNKVLVNLKSPEHLFGLATTCESAERLLTAMGDSGALPQPVKEKMAEFITEATRTMYGSVLITTLFLLDDELKSIHSLSEWDTLARELRLLSNCCESIIQRLEAIQKLKDKADEADILAILETINKSKLPEKRKLWIKNEWLPELLGKHYPGMVTLPK